jgi:hypothetical protein
MKHRDRTFADIASKHLNIPSLRTRKSDSLDFHEVSVWAVRSALKAAFDEGVRVNQTLTPAHASGLPTRFDDYEIHGMKRLDCPGLEEEPVGRIIDNCEQVSDHDAEFWSLFGHIPGQGLDCVGDFATREHAEEVFARITGRRYADGANAIKPLTHDGKK